nr:hypothetical protein [uncultured Cohaesibacter sp.]
MSAQFNDRAIYEKLMQTHDEFGRDPEKTFIILTGAAMASAVAVDIDQGQFVDYLNKTFPKLKVEMEKILNGAAT